MAAVASNAYIFSSLEKFSDGNAAELNSFLSKFDRCCLIGNKIDAENAPVKGQLLMLFVEGRARATLEEFEQTRAGVQQTYADLAGKLREHFDNAETRETSMSLFEARVKKVNESEEEYMLQLLMLYKTANPEHTDAVTLLAVKRKFMAGIPDTLRKNIFVFCPDPFAVGVTREQLLTHCRKARNILLTQNPEQNGTEYSSQKVLLSSNVDEFWPGGDQQQVLSAINNLSVQMQAHVDNTNSRFEDVNDALAAIGNDRNTFRGRGGGSNRNSNRGRGFSNSNRGGQSNNGRDGFHDGSRGNNNSGRGNFSRRGGRGGFNNNNNRQTVCYNCNGTNHIARFCRAPRSSGNC